MCQKPQTWHGCVLGVLDESASRPESRGKSWCLIICPCMSILGYAQFWHRCVLRDPDEPTNDPICKWSKWSHVSRMTSPSNPECNKSKRKHKFNTQDTRRHTCSGAFAVPVCRGEGAKPKGDALTKRPTLAYGHEPWVVTERTRSRTQAAEMSFLPIPGENPGVSQLAWEPPWVPPKERKEVSRAKEIGCGVTNVPATRLWIYSKGSK